MSNMILMKEFKKISKSDTNVADSKGASLKERVQNKKNSYYFSWGERHSIISTESWLRGYVNRKNVIANDNRKVFMLVKNGSVQTYNTEEDLPIAHKSGEKILNHRFLNNHLKNTKKVRDQYNELYQEIKNKKKSHLKDKELLRIFKKYQDLYDTAWAYYKVSQPEYLEPAHDKLKSLLKKNFKDVEEKFITLTTPTDIDLIKEEELAAYKLSFKKKISENDLLKHSEKFPWLFWNTYDYKIVMDFLRKKFADLQSIEKKERVRRIEHVKEEHKKHNLEFGKIINSAKKNKEEIKYLSSIFGKLAVDRLKLKSWWGGAEYLFLPLFDEIANRATINTEELLMTYQISDIEWLLQERKKLSENLRKSRKKLYAIALEEDELKFYEAKEAKEKFYTDIKLEEKIDYKESGIKGVSANLGKVTGKAYIVSVEDLKQLIRDMASFKEGDILVTTMTQPTMVSLARKASAIVTNEGGITSHASILSREFGIPCVVGTHTATEKIKTGDVIEVDANNGVVRVLKKAK